MQFGRRQFIWGSVSLATVLGGCAGDSTDDDENSETEANGNNSETEANGNNSETEANGNNSETEDNGDNSETEVNGDNSETEVNGDNSETEAESTTTETLANETARIHEDEYKYYEFAFDATGTVEYEFVVRRGPNIDVFVAEQAELNHYENGDRFQVYTGSQDTASGSESATVESGTYYLVLDNTSAGWAEPPSNFDDDVAEVEIEATITY